MRPAPIATMTAAALALALVVSLASSGCVTERVAPVEPGGGLGSFAVEILGIDPALDRLDAAGAPIEGCSEAPPGGGPSCRRPFPVEERPVLVSVVARALDRRGSPTSWDGVAEVSVRPGRVVGASPAGMLIELRDGESAPLDLPIVHAHGEARVWLEDCGTLAQPGSFATGVSESLWFEAPRIDQMNATTDNTRGALAPRPDNACAIAGDPRFGLGLDAAGDVALVGANAPPPAVGTSVQLRGCGRAEYDARAGAGDRCETGPLVVTGVDASGFYVTDLSPSGVAAGFNAIHVFTGVHPTAVGEGDLVLDLRGASAEIDGETQLRDPVWERDEVASGADLIPLPVHLDPALVRASVGPSGANVPTALGLEALEGALVCVDRIAPAARLQRCEPDCETRCAEEYGCSEASAFVDFGRWVGDILGNYEAPEEGATPLALAFMTHHADPAFDPFAFAAHERLELPGARRTVRVIGHLRHVASAHPPWVVVARGPLDLEVREAGAEGGCP